MSSRGRVLVLWNSVEEDIYEKWRDEGPKTLPWDDSRSVPDVGTVEEEMDAFMQALRDARFEVELINVEDDLDRVIGAIRVFRPDAIFNLVEYFQDDQIQEAYIAGLFEMMKVPFTGNRPLALATCQNKFRTKLILEAAGLPTAPFFLAKSLPIGEGHDLTYPLIVKPAFEDASGGIDKESVVHNHAALEARIAYLFKEFEMPALVEEYVDGREIHAAILGNSPPEVLPLFEMEFDDSEFNPNDEWRPQIISYRAKWDPHSKDFYAMDAVVPPEDLSPKLSAELQRIARAAYIAVGCRDYARVDMRIEDDEIYILEVNPNPDLVDGAAYMLCATASGRSYADTVGAIADLAIARGRKAPPDPEKVGKPTDTLLLEHHNGEHVSMGPAVPNEPPAHYHVNHEEPAGLNSEMEISGASALAELLEAAEQSDAELEDGVDLTVPSTSAFDDVTSDAMSVDGISMVSNDVPGDPMDTTVPSDDVFVDVESDVLVEVDSGDVLVDVESDVLVEVDSDDVVVEVDPDAVLAVADTEDDDEENTAVDRVLPIGEV